MKCSKVTVVMVAVVMVSLFMLVGSASANIMTLEPTPKDMYDLDHYKYYTWGVGTARDVSDFVITGARLNFKQIRNYNNTPNVLYVTLLDSDGLGLGGTNYNETAVYRDNQGGGDAFAGQGTHLVTYVNLPSTPQDISYVFDASEIVAFNAYMQNDGDFALGFDPDCHFYNKGVSLDICYEVVPEPATMTLLGLGGVMVLVRRKRRAC